MQSISLYFTEGSSDKEYHAELVPQDAGFVVNFRYGARGKALKPGTKTESPVSLEAAQKIYSKLVAEKMAKGYTPTEGGVPYTGTPQGERVSGWRPVLLAPIDAAGREERVASDLWVASEKMDGERRAVEVVGGTQPIRGINRKGLYVGVPQVWGEVLGRLPVGTIVDGEHIGDNLYIFDCPQLGSRDIRGLGYDARMKALEQAVELVVKDSASTISIQALKCVSILWRASTPQTKRALVDRVEAEGGEGVVFRRAHDPYETGEGSVKFKFLESSTCIVKSRNADKRSVKLTMLDAKGLEVDVGNVTIPANQEIPQPGSLIDVRYMHMFEGGSLYQPVFDKVRTDLERSAATLAQVTRISRKGAAPGAPVQDEGEDADGVEHVEPPGSAAERMRG